MTPEQRQKLHVLIELCGGNYSHSADGSLCLMSEGHVKHITDYVDSLLAAKDSEIADLKADNEEMRLAKEFLPDSVMDAYELSHDQGSESGTHLYCAIEQWLKESN